MMKKEMMKQKDMMMSEAEMKKMDEMRDSSAYNNKKHPDHAKTVRAVSEAYKKGYKRNRTGHH